MLTAHVLSAARFGNLPDQDVGAEPVIRVETDLPLGQDNAFYMDPTDFDGHPVDPADMKPGDLILFDEQDGPFHKRVSWAGRGFRQRSYSFDWGATSSDGQGY